MHFAADKNGAFLNRKNEKIAAFTYLLLSANRELGIVNPQLLGATFYSFFFYFICVLFALDFPLLSYGCYGTRI